MPIHPRNTTEWSEKNIYKVTCPTMDTYKDLSKFKFLKDKLYILSDPILNIKDLSKLKLGWNSGLANYSLLGPADIKLLYNIFHAIDNLCCQIIQILIRLH